MKNVQGCTSVHKLMCTLKKLFIPPLVNRRQPQFSTNSMNLSMGTKLNVSINTFLYFQNSYLGQKVTPIAVQKLGHSTYIRTVSSQRLLSSLLIQLKLIYGPFGQGNMHSTIDFCPRPAKMEINVHLHPHLHTLYNIILRIARNFLETRENIKIESHPFYHIICD